MGASGAGVAPRLLVAAHGTASPAGSASTAALVAAVAATLPGVAVSACFLDVAGPSLAEALAATPGPAVVVPLLLSTGYHVQTDIPAVAAARPDARVSAHLGPHPRIVSARAGRLAAATAGGPPPASVALVGVGSSRPQARPELEAAARRLGARLGRPVTAVTLTEDVPARLAALEPPVAVAPYLLAEGVFLDRLRAAAHPHATVAAPIGAHPDLVALVGIRYREAAGAAPVDSAGSGRGSSAPARRPGTAR
jgi:sirohydrochlorin ferrochelatase